MRLVDDLSILAVEFRSKDDQGRAAKEEMAAKRTDYFEAGTQIVWDVDPQAGTIASYSAEAPEHPAIFAAGQVATAEPAVPGWKIGVDELLGR